MFFILFFLFFACSVENKKHTLSPKNQSHLNYLQTKNTQNDEKVKRFYFANGNGFSTTNQKLTEDLNAAHAVLIGLECYENKDSHTKIQVPVALGSTETHFIELSSRTDAYQFPIYPGGQVPPKTSQGGRSLRSDFCHILFNEPGGLVQLSPSPNNSRVVPPQEELFRLINGATALFGFLRFVVAYVDMANNIMERNNIFKNQGYAKNNIRFTPNSAANFYWEHWVELTDLSVKKRLGTGSQIILLTEEAGAALYKAHKNDDKSEFIRVFNELYKESSIDDQSKGGNLPPAGIVFTAWLQFIKKLHTLHTPNQADAINSPVQNFFVEIKKRGFEMLWLTGFNPIFESKNYTAHQARKGLVTFFSALAYLLKQMVDTYNSIFMIDDRAKRSAIYNLYVYSMAAAQHQWKKDPIFLSQLEEAITTGNTVLALAMMNSRMIPIANQTSVYLTVPFWYPWLYWFVTHIGLPFRYEFSGAENMDLTPLGVQGATAY